jgi:mRNA-degrading endonuclease RelE of RelBE toxin-antitoxin system
LWRRRLGDEDLRRWQDLLLEDANRGDSIPGCGLLRKVRFGDPSRGKGKRGGIRVIYMHTPEASRIDMITMFGKDEADDLSKKELRLVCEFARDLRDELLRDAFRTRSLKGRQR